MAGRFARRCVGGSTTLIRRLMVSAAAVSLNLPAYAQVTASDTSSVPNAITTNTALSGTLNGNNQAGYFVTNGATLTINNGLLQNFTTTGGSGSGGGLGAGGAIFIDTGGSVVLNNTSFLHNGAVGGTGGTSSPYGGTLDNITPSTTPDASPNGANGVNGQVHEDNYVFFGDGKGNGATGFGVGNGGNATNGLGGIGGTGGAGGAGWSYDPLDTENLNISIAKVASDTGKVVVDGVNVAAWVASGSGFFGSQANPFLAPLASIAGTFNIYKAILAGVSTANDITGLGADVATLTVNQQKLQNWYDLVSAGLAGNGGAGEAGGKGGNGSYGFGGGAGGQGGAYGVTTLVAGLPGVTTTLATDGAGGAGGAGGNGGFGGGGGAGGYGFGAGQNGNGTNGATSTSGAGGAGGAGGFGAGAGSKGGATGVSNASGGGGGDGYGGAIFVNSQASLTITGNATFSGNSALGGASLNGGLAGGTAGTDLFMMQGSTVIIAPGASSSNVPNFVIFNGTIADNSVSSIGAPSTSQVAGYPVSGGAYLTIYSGVTIFNGANTYSGQTVINGGALGGPLNNATNTSGAPNYALTDGALQATDGVGLPTTSNLNFSGPGQFTGGVLQIAGQVLGNNVVAPTTFTRYVSANPDPFGGSNPGGVQWTGSGGFAALYDPLTVTLSGGQKLAWGVNGFVPFGSSLIFGSATSNYGVTFTNAIDISGGTIAGGTAASILVANNGTPAGSTATMAGVISGTGDLSIGGGGFNGTLILTAANTYTGATQVLSGTLELSGAGSIASSSSLTIGSGATLDISGTAAGATIPNLNGSGNVSLGAQELTVANGGNFSGVLSDGGASGKTGGSLIIAGGTEILSGINTYTGDTTINQGATLALVGTGSISNSSPVAVNGIFDVSQVTGGGTAIQSLSGSNTGQVLIGSNFLVITNGSTTFAGDINDGGAGGGTGGSLMVTGGTQTLSGVNTYTGLTIIAPQPPTGTATLALSGGGSIASSSEVFVGTNGIFDISQTTSGASITTLEGTGTVALGSTLQTLTITNGSTVFGGSITDGGVGAGIGGNLAISGGTQTLSGNNTYTGTTTIDHGATLALLGIGSIATSSDVIDNGIFDISQTALGAAIKTLSGTGTVSLGGQLLTITAGSTTFSGQINDGGLGGGIGGALVVAGGTQTLAGTNHYTGGTLIEPGATLALTGSGSIANSAFVADFGTFDISQTTAGASIITLLGSGNVALGGQELTITNGSTTFSGVLSDGGIGHGTKGSLIVSGGTQTLSGVNTYTGDTTIAPNPVGGTATLALFGNGSIATSSMVAIATGGTFDISQTFAGASITTLADAGATPSGHVALGAQTLTITNGSTTFSGVIADSGIGGGVSGNLVVSGGTQTLAGVNTYTGSTTIAPSAPALTATLALVGNGSIATSSVVSIATGGTFDISGTNAGASITTLSGTGSVVLGSELLIITAGAAGPTGTNPLGIYGGVISGLGGVAITGGHQELTGVNSYQGGTLITNGAILSVNNSNSLGANTSLLTINNGDLVADGSITIPQPVKLLGAPPGTDQIDLNSNNVTLSGAISGPGVLTVVNGGSLNLTGTTSGIGGIVLGPGVTFTASASANAGLGTTPIILVPTAGPSAPLFTGTVHVVGPLDVVNGAAPELIILPGDSLVGVGNINASVVIEGGGAKAPGDGPGAQFYNNGPVTVMPGANYTVEIDGPLYSATNCANPAGCAGQYSTVVVTGGNTYTANGTIMPILRNIPVPANNTYIAPVASSYLAVLASGGVFGSFTSLIQPAGGAGLPAGTRFDALYYNFAAPQGTTSAVTYAENSSGNPTAVALWVTPATYQNLSYWHVSLTQNQTQVALGLDALRGVNDLDPAASLPAGLKNNPQATWIFGQLYPQQPANLPTIFNTLSGEVATDAKQVGFQTTTQFLQFMLNSSISGRRFGGGALAFAATPDEPAAAPDNAASSALDFAAITKAPRAPSFEQRWSVWGSAFGGGLNANGDPTVGSASVSARTYGGGAGVDYLLTPDAVVGFAVAGGGGYWNVAQGLGRGRTDFFQGGVYATRYFGPAYLAAAASVTNHWMTTDRVAFAGDHLQASFNGQSYGGRVEAGWRYMMPTVAVTPYLAGEIQRFSTPAYSEMDLVGGGFGLQFNAAATTEARGEAGARLDSLLTLNPDTVLILHARGAWAYQKITDPSMVAMFEAALLPGALPGAGIGFTVNGAVIPNSLGLASAGAELRFSNNWSLLGNFNGEFGAGGQSYSGNGTVRYTW